MTVREGRDVNIECVVLDAMGVVFRAADDVAELLVPFVRSRGGVEDVGAIEAAYLDASRGSITADAFWLKVGLSPSLEDDYLSGHALTPGARDFLAHASDMNAPVWLLSNHVERWSRKLRSAFALNTWLCGAVISSDATARKPDAAIFATSLHRSGYDPPRDSVRRRPREERRRCGGVGHSRVAVRCDRVCFPDAALRGFR